MAYKVTISGIPELQKAFEAKRKEIEEAVIRDLDEGADVIIQSAKSKVHSISHDLENSINKNEVWERGGKISVYVGVEVNEVFSADGYYARFVEKGHDTEMGTSRVKAHPYLRPAFNENKKQIQNKIESDLRNIIGR